MFFFKKCAKMQLKYLLKTSIYLYRELIFAQKYKKCSTIFEISIFLRCTEF